MQMKLIDDKPRPFDGEPVECVGGGLTFCDRLAAHFKARPGAWIDGMALAQIAGSYAWRSRVSDLRRPPYNLTIQNQQRREGRRVISEYRLVVERGEAA